MQAHRKSSIPPAQRGHQFTRHGFTLVEMLTVIVIIGILAGLISAAAVQGRAYAIRASVVLEIGQLSNALKSYQNQYGELPPDGTSTTDFIRHLNRVFPRFVIQGSSASAQWTTFKNAFDTKYGTNIASLDAATALVLFLGGPPSTTTAGKLGTFSADPTDPFDLNSGNNPSPSRIQPLFPFTETRLTQDPGSKMLRYVPVTGSSSLASGLPYVYFRACSSGWDLASSGSSVTVIAGYDPNNKNKAGRTQSYSITTAKGFSSTGTVYPYGHIDPTTGAFTWYEPTGFQILCAGQDNSFGSSNILPLQTYSGKYWTATLSTGMNESDNLSNFSTGMLGDVK